MEGEHRHFYGKSQRKGEKEPDLNAWIQRQVVKIEKVERIHAGRLVIGRVEVKDGHQHQQAAHHGEQDKFDRGIDLAVSSPDTDQEVHRDQHGFPEHVKEEQVERDKHADDPCLEHQHEDQVFLGSLFDVCPGGKDGDRHQESGQQHEE